MKTFEKILLVLIILAVILRVLNLPGVGPVILFTAAITMLFYLLLGFALFNELTFQEIFQAGTYKELSKRALFSGVLGSLSLLLVTVTILFPVLKLPGTNLMLTAGSALALIFVFLLAMADNTPAKRIFKQVLIRLVIVILVGLVLWSFDVADMTYIREAVES